MRMTSARDRAAATFFGVTATAAGFAAVITASLILVAVAIVLAIASVAAMRSYPIDRTW